MDEREVAQYWDENAPVWTRLVRAGHDRYRDHINSPAFMAVLPNVKGLRGLDIGCGEGHNTRLLAREGATMVAVDITGAFVEAAEVHERAEPLGIRYLQASGARLPFAASSFDFVAAFMSFMDMPAHEQVIAQCRRVLRPGGFLQFSISHPCFATRRWKWLRGADERKVGLDCGDYFCEVDGQIDSWMFGSAPEESKREFPEFRIPRFNRTLSSWLNLLIANGFVLEQFSEPTPSDRTLAEYPDLYDARIIAYFLIVRCRKFMA